MRIGLIFVLLSALSSGVNSRIFYVIPEKMNWTEAQVYCRKYYTDLASVDDQAELDELIQRVPKGLKVDMWIGLYRKNGNYPLIWSDQSKSTFRSWMIKQPNNYGGIQFCTYTSPDGLWNDWECPDKLAFVCYALSSGVNSRIFYVIPEKMNWTEAQVYCRKYYTDLASVDDQAELDELIQRVPKGLKVDMWIGLYRKNGNYPLIWSDQSKSTFRSWMIKQPNNYGGIQFCTYTSPDGLWNDWECPDKLAFVCYDMKRQTFRLEVKSSRNVNDPDLQKEILAKLEQILKQNGLTEEAKVWWKKISGENVFQKMWYQKSDVSKAACKRNSN